MNRRSLIIQKQVNRVKTCKGCGEDFECPEHLEPHWKPWREKKYCSRQCHYDDKRIQKTCEICGEDFEVPQSRHDARFCSDECRGENVRQNPDKYNLFEDGHDVPDEWREKLAHWKGKELSNDHKQAISESRKLDDYNPVENPDNPLGNFGEDHWNWKGGASFEPYPPEFNEKLKEKIRERDGYMCQNCGMHQSECRMKFGKKLSIHHKDENKENCSEENLVSLCAKCHSGIHNSGDRIL